ncbi:phosphatidylserine decarboxylase, putative [Phytophthora infestans T30-4]|uniref:phosphatidylserine decarboxylase n=1 Tax=Phytophthora infestans (strain T30-4) TaxID=403677 RepID=D0P0B1_PHYIT|nr:phosphatidylserine decarboxylase, putative [Phytophthora infestans T30-4]EEY70292.1 phosphatidylserine decarboxylase, putative [Phytophthora infestans T30-4]|eukprot:XP_002996948.1 phosphatidylserine decarboxylase, putative [Phytophthora infestans T30-4]
MLCKAPRRVGLLKAQQRRRFSQQQQKQKSEEGATSSGSIFSGSWKIPATMGFALIGFLQWQHLNHPTDEERKTHPAEALRRLPGTHTAFEDTMATERQLQSLKLFPYRAASRLWGEVHDKELPSWMREPVYKAWTAVFNCKLDEMKYPLQDYANLGEFFSRPFETGRSSQIKGARYRLDEFLGDLPSFFTSKTSASKGKKMFHCVLYLAPGDYHRIHAPVDWQVEERRHFPGNLFPVNKTAARLIPSLFVENERVALLGEWEHGFFSLTAVGATNVGSIVITKEPEFRTNTALQDPLMGHCITKNYGGKVDTARGEEMAQFKLGSTVVLVFEAPESFQFTIKPGDKVSYGSCSGS